MGFAEAVQTIYTRRYAKFAGRAARSEMWWFYLFHLIVLLALAALVRALGGEGLTSDPARVPVSAMAGMVVMALFILASALPTISVTVRRLHDGNLSGWWYLAAIAASFLPVLGWLATIALLVVCAMPGTEGPNRFGEDPRRI